jgi:hypothetical protein
VRIDYFRMGIFVAFTTLMLCGLTTGGTTHPLKSANVLSPLILGLTGLGVFVLVEWKMAKAPMVPLRNFSNRTANAGYFGAFIHGLDFIFRANFKSKCLNSSHSSKRSSVGFVVLQVQCSSTIAAHVT